MRIFIGIPISEKIRIALRSEVEKIKPHIYKGRYSSWEGYHVTLKFLGDVSEQVMVELASKLEGASFETRPFEIEFTTLDAFHKSNGDVLWLGVTQSQSLDLLKAEVEVLTASMGFEREPRQYVPHLTIGRGIRYTQGFEKVVKHWSFKRHRIFVDRIVLFQSVQVDNQLRYVPLLTKRIGVLSENA